MMTPSRRILAVLLALAVSFTTGLATHAQAPQGVARIKERGKLEKGYFAELGLKVEANPVLAVVASISCQAERLPWGQLRLVQK